MKQAIDELKRSLLSKKEHRAKQQERMERLQTTIQNTENDIQQIEYTLHRIEDAGKNSRARKIIPYADITDFFIRITRIFERVQHRLRHGLNYRIACMLIYGRYHIKSRTRLPGKEYLRFETVLTYFKRERAMI